MTLRLHTLRFLPVAFVVALTSCGGGGDVAGGLSEFSVVPTGVTISAVKGDTLCKQTGGQYTVTIVGGTPPYRVVSSNPSRFTTDKTEVTGKNPTFKVTVGPGCMEDMTVLVLDYLSRSTVFTVTVEPGEEDTNATATSPTGV